MLIQLLKTTAALAGVLGFIFLLAWVVRKLNLTQGAGDGGTDGWRMLGVKMLGPRSKIFVMEVGSKLLLVGVHEKTMVPLMEVSDAADREKIVEALGRKKKQITSFTDFLRRAETK